MRLPLPLLFFSSLALALGVAVLLLCCSPAQTRVSATDTPDERVVTFTDCHKGASETRLEAKWRVDDYALQWSICSRHEVHLHFLTHARIWSPSSQTKTSWEFDPYVHREKYGLLFCSIGGTVVPFLDHDEDFQIDFFEGTRQEPAFSLCRVKAA